MGSISQNYLDELVMMYSSGSFDMNGFPFVSLVRFECDPAATFVYHQPIYSFLLLICMHVCRKLVRLNPLPTDLNISWFGEAKPHAQKVERL